MKKLNETPSERQGEAGVENKEPFTESAESGGDLLARVAESSEQTVAEGDSLLAKTAVSIKPDEVEGGPGLLQTAKQKMSELGERIQGLATSTGDRIKETIVGKDVKGMTDEELADHLRNLRQEHLKAYQHNKAVRRGEKFDLGGFRAGHALDQEMKKERERAEAAREVNRRGMEVLTPEEERSKKVSEIESNYIRLRTGREYRDEQGREEIDFMLAELEAQANKIDHEIPSYVTRKYTPAEIAAQEMKKERERRAMNTRLSEEEARQRELFPHWTVVQKKQKEKEEKAIEEGRALERQKEMKEDEERRKNRPVYGRGGGSWSTGGTWIGDDGKIIRP